MKTAGRYPRFFTSYSGSGMTGVAPATLLRDDGRDSVAPAILQRNGGGEGVAPAILQWNGDEDGGPKGAELLCNRG